MNPQDKLKRLRQKDLLSPESFTFEEARKIVEEVDKEWRERIDKILKGETDK